MSWAAIVSGRLRHSSSPASPPSTTISPNAPNAPPSDASTPPSTEPPPATTPPAATPTSASTNTTATTTTATTTTSPTTPINNNNAASPGPATQSSPLTTTPTISENSSPDTSSLTTPTMSNSSSKPNLNLATHGSTPNAIMDHQSMPYLPPISRSPRSATSASSMRHRNHSKSRNNSNNNRNNKQKYSKKYNNNHNHHNHRNHHNSNSHNSHSHNNHHKNQSNQHNNNFAYNAMSHANVFFDSYSNLRFHNHYHRQQSPTSPLTSPRPTRPNNHAMWEDPAIQATYRLWTQHISFFMAQPVHFFGVFVTDYSFRRSVFCAGLTFHPDTDPAHPVLINLNYDSFGMASRITALAPPAGLDFRSANPPPTLPPPSSAPIPMSQPSNCVNTSIPMPTSAQPIPSMHPVPSMHPIPFYIAAPMPPYYASVPPPPPPGSIINADQLANPPYLIDGFTGQPLYPAEISPDTYAVNGSSGATGGLSSGNGPGDEKHVLKSSMSSSSSLRKLTDLRIDGSDTDSERYSDADIHQNHPHSRLSTSTATNHPHPHPHHSATNNPSSHVHYQQNRVNNGMKMGYDMHKFFVYNDFHHPHRTEPLRDGRSKVVSRAEDFSFPPSPICTTLSDKAKVELNEQIESLFPKITPPNDYPAKRDDLLTRLRAIIAREWEGAGINVYGSAGNGLGLRSADVDMSLYMPTKALAAATTTAATLAAASANGVGTQTTSSLSANATSSMLTTKWECAKVILARLATIMELNGMKILSKFLDARVPVIKMYDSTSNLQVDVCVNNTLAVLNTQLLKAYVDLDERFRYVCILVKYWAKRRDLNDTYHGTLSSYAYTLLVIHYLQTLDPPVLPCLQRMVNGNHVQHDDEIPLQMTANGGPELYNTYFDRTVTPSVFQSKNTDAVHELLLGLFRYYAYEFQYRTDLASIRLGKRTSRAERQWDDDGLTDEWEPRMMMTNAGTSPMPLTTTNRISGTHNASPSPQTILRTPQHQQQKSGRAQQRQQRTQQQSTSNASSTQDKTPRRKGPPNRSNNNNNNNDNRKSSDDNGGPNANFSSSSSSTSNVAAAINISATAKINTSATAKTISTNNNNSNNNKREGVKPTVNGVVERRGERVEFSGQRPRLTSRHLFCIEDPFDIDHDLSRGMERAAVKVIQQEMMRAYEIMAETGDLVATCEEYG